MAETAIDVPIIPKDETAPVEVVLDDKATTEAKTEGAKAPIVSADEGAKILQEQVAKAQRESAERLAAADRKIAEAFKRASDAERETATVKLDQVGTIIELLGKDRETAKRDYRVAMEAGDFDKAAEAQERIAIAAARVVEAEKGKIALSDEVKNPRRQEAPQPVANDPVEIMAQSMASPRAATWIRSHPELVVSGAQGVSLAPKAMAAHYAALDAGNADGSDAYFDFLNSHLAPRQQRQEASEGRNQDRAPISAPVGRDIIQAPGAQRPNSVRLDPDEVRTAIDTYSPLYPKDTRDQLLRRYVNDKLTLIDEGKIARR